MPETTSQSSSSNPQRLLYVDNIRIYLICLVVLHHVAVGYGGSGGWPIKESPTDEISPILFFIFNGINQSYFMSFFFLLSGFFVPRSYDRKGAGGFLRDRLIRLGIPLAFYAFLISLLIEFVVRAFAHDQAISFWEIWIHRISEIRLETGPLWFVEGLLLFSVIYAAFRLISDRYKSASTSKSISNGFPSNQLIALAILALASGVFLVRIWFPVGEYVYHFQLGHFVHYVFCFFIGVLAYRSNWFDNLTDAQGRLWGKIAWGAVIAMPLMMGGMMAIAGSDIDPDALMGGFTLLAALVASWESIACISIIIGLLHFFRTQLDFQGNLLRNLSPNAYTVYIIHELTITALMIAILSIAIPTALKFAIVALIGVPLCFLLSHLVIRRIPFSKRVLG